MNRYARILMWLLRVEGVIMLVALGAVVMPTDWMNTINRRSGLGELPRGPVIEYLTRSLSGFYALHGALLLFLAGDVVRHLVVIRFLALAGVVFGLLMLALDLSVAMPLGWTIQEGPGIVAMSLLFFWLARRAKAPG